MGWVIRAYERSGDRLQREHVLEEELRNLFRSELGVSTDDPLVDSYRLSLESIKEIGQRLGVEFDLSGRVDYFLDWDA